MVDCSTTVCKFDLMIATTLLVVSFLCMILFYREWKRQKRSENEQYIPYALVILYLLLFTTTALIIYSNFFVEESLLFVLKDTRAFFIGVVVLSISGIGILVYIAERITRLDKYYHFFLIYFIVFMSLVVSLNLFGVNIFNIFFFIGEFPFYILIGQFIYRLIYKTSGDIRRKMIIVLLGATLFLIVFMQIIVLILVGEFQLMLRMKAFLLLGSILTGYGFYSIPSFTEFDWDKKLRHLYILNKDGLCLYQYPFRESIADQDLLGGSLMAIQGLMKEMIQTDKFLKVIDHEDTKLIFKQSDHAIAVMIADDDLYIVHQKVEQVMNQFELIFGESMKNWVGNLDIFKPIGPIIAKIFEVKVKENV